MSDKPLGPGWWQASDGSWHPPDLHPSMLGDGPAPAATPGVPGDAVAPAPPITAPPSVPESTSVVRPEPVTRPEPVVRPAPVAQPAAVAVPAAVPAGAVGPAVAAGVDPVATVEMPPLGPVPPRPVPSLDDVPGRPGADVDPENRTDAAPMFPDLFQQAVAGSRLADTITVHFADGEHRESLDVPDSSGPAAGAHLLVSTAGTLPGEVGEFIGASARKRRWHH